MYETGSQYTYQVYLVMSKEEDLCTRKSLYTRGPLVLGQIRISQMTLVLAK